MKFNERQKEEKEKIERNSRDFYKFIIFFLNQYFTRKRY